MRYQAVALCLLASCSSPEETLPEFVLDFRASCDDEPVDEVAVFLNGRRAGVTNDQGHLRVRTAGREGQELPLRVECPDRCRNADVPHTVRLVTVRSLAEEQRFAGTLVPLQCLPADRATAVVVWAPEGPDLPVRLYGQEVARTDSQGVAHLLVRLAPLSRFALELDTRQHPRLRPQNPTKSFTVADRDEIFVFEQSFALQPEPRSGKQRRRGRRRRSSKGAAPAMPTRL